MKNQDILSNDLQNKSIRAVVFDLFGTIGNWSNKWLSNPAQILLHYAPNLNKKESIEIVKLMEWDDDIIQFSNIINIKKYKELEKKRWEKAAKIAGIFLDETMIRLMRLVIETRQLELYDDVLPVLRMLHHLRIPWIICSNASLDVSLKINTIIPAELSPTVSIFSCEVGIRKPNPKIYSFITKSLKIHPSNILFIGDRVDCDYLGPRLLGFNSILLQRKKFSTSFLQELEIKKVPEKHRWTSLYTLQKLILEHGDQV